MRFVRSYWFLAVITLIGCADSGESNKTSNQFDYSKKEPESVLASPPVVVKVNKDSLKTITPGKNGIALPKVVKADHSNKRPYTGIRSITPGISYLPQTNEEIVSGKKPIKTKKPGVVVIDKEKLIISTPGKNGLLQPKVYTIPTADNDEQIDSIYTIQHGDTIRPPKIVIAKQPQPITTVLPRYSDDAIVDLSHLGVEEGLLNNTVADILEDRQGNLWFGTRGGGVSRYDGKTFTNYMPEHGLSGQYIFALTEDRSGNLWFGSFFGGITKYDGKTFTQYTTAQGLSHNTIRSILEDQNGNLWIGTQGGGISRFDGQTFTNFGIEQGLLHNIVISILEDKHGNLWFGTGKGVSRYDGESFTSFTTEQGLSDRNVGSILEDRHGDIWFATRNGISRYNGSSITNYTEEQGLNSNFILSLCEDRKGNILAGTYGGGVLNFDGTSFTGLTTDHGLSSNTVDAIFEDSSGILWFGTTDGGFTRYNSKKFTHITTRQGLLDNKVNSIFEDKSGDFWFGSFREGLSHFDGETFINYTVEQGLTENSIVSISQDQKGTIWLGIFFNGISSFDGSSFSYYDHIQGLNDTAIESIIKDKNGNMWFGANGEGVYRFDGKSFTNFSTTQGLVSNVINTIFEDRKGNLWFGTGRGISRFDGENFTNYTTEQGLSNNDVISIYEDSMGTFWFGTDGGGVSRFDGEGFETITKAQGLSSDIIWSVVGDNNDNIWLSTQSGISLIVPGSGESKESQISDRKIYSFDKHDGLKGLDFYPKSALLDSDNRMMWGSDDGLTVLDLNTFELPKDVPRIQLNGVSINDEFIDYHSFSDTTEINSSDWLKENIKFASAKSFYNYPLELELTHNLNHLTFHFSAIDWSAPQKIKYSYKIDGLDEDWSLPKSDANASYRTLPYGTHTLKVRAIGAAQKWSEPYTYTFVIYPPWWHTWWARSVYIILAAAFFLGAIRIRTRSINNQKKELELIVEERTAMVMCQKEEITEQKEEIEEQNEELETMLDQLKNTQSQLVQSEKMASLGQLTAGIAHEINNPLNFIQGNTVALSKDVEDLKNLLDKYREGQFQGGITSDEILAFEKKIDLETLSSSLQKEFEGIREGTRRTSEIVKGLSDFSQGNQLKMGPADIHHGIDVTLNLLTSRLTKDIEIIKNYDESIGEIDCNIGQLNQVFLNLFLNALDAVDGKGEIEVSTKKLDEQVRIAIKDNGVGISKENLNRIFDPFFTTKDVGQGTGLGLSISHGIIENHGGKIEVKSLPVGEAGEEARPPARLSVGDDSVGREKGAEFVIYLPTNK